LRSGEGTSGGGDGPGGDSDLQLTMRDQPVIVTGAASGIGRTTAELFIEAGATVTACDIRPFEMDASPEHRLRVSVGDLGKEDYVAAMVEEAGAEEPLGALVHCAGIFDGPELDVTLDMWEKVIGSNLTSGFLLLKHCIPQFRRRGRGAVVLIGSISGINGGYRSGPAYAASKAGVHGLAKWAAKRYAPEGIRVNAIAPGTIRTPMSRDTPESLTPLGTIGSPADVARMALFLVSPMGSYITGTIAVVDGGMTI
jgi:NAD(P)-dependent dehydrogenase (short-subunit alcohol dehydrogenase family)